MTTKAAEVASIYVIKHPITKEIRYVGRTIMPINDRKNAHINTAVGHRDSSQSLKFLKWLMGLGSKKRSLDAAIDKRKGGAVTPVKIRKGKRNVL